MVFIAKICIGTYMPNIYWKKIQNSYSRKHVFYVCKLKSI